MRALFFLGRFLGLVFSLFLGQALGAIREARAGDHLFERPSPALSSTKYAGDCGGISASLRAEMPPVDDQRQSPWCVTFADKALLDYHVHRHTKGDHYQDRISAVDLNSWDSWQPASRRGSFPNTTDGTDPFTILEGIQNAGEAYREQDLPFDQSLFDPHGTLARLTAYYEKQKPFAEPGLFQCREHNQNVAELEHTIPGLTELLKESPSELAFLTALKGQLGLKAAAGAKRHAILPAFDVRSLEARSGDQIFEEFRRNLLDKRPTVIGVCATQMMQLPLLGNGEPVPPEDKQKCGEHALVVTGMKNVHGECLVEVRNSWGTEWPVSSGGGYAAIPAKTLLGFLNVSHGVTSLRSLSERRTAGPARNEILTAEASYTGESWKGVPQGQGALTEADGNIVTGTFAKGSFVKGTFRGKLSDGAAYVGEYSGGMVNGEGTLTETDGQIFTGTFENGEFKKGTMKGLIDAARGIYYEGPLVNGQTTSEGKFTDKDGNPVSPD